MLFQAEVNTEAHARAALHYLRAWNRLVLPSTYFYLKEDHHSYIRNLYGSEKKACCTFIAEVKGSNPVQA